jgi:IS605 OrfB family transposase
MANKYRCYPKNKEMESAIGSYCGQRRYLWNLLVEQFNYWHPGCKPPTNKELFKQLTQLRKGTFFSEGDSAMQQQVIQDFIKAKIAFFKGEKGRPQFKKKGANDGFRIRDVKVKKINKKWSAIYVPKVGWLKFIRSRELPKDYGMATIKKDKINHWYVSFTAPQPEIVHVPTLKFIGIDRGVATTLVTSDGVFLRIPTMSQRDQQRLLVLEQERERQHIARRKAKGVDKAIYSKKLDDTNLKIAKIWARYTRRRNDWIEKQTTKLVKKNDIIALERLNTKGMTKAPKPKLAEDGVTYLPNGAAAKAGLNKVILQSCWGQIEKRLIDKAGAAGVKIIFVNPRFTSQECRKCHHTHEDNRKSQTEFQCVNCNHKNHADRNAAHNILARGLSELGIVAPAGGHSAYVPARETPIGKRAA